jgi:hypothetical protein
LQKAELAVADMAGDGGLLRPAQAHRFMKMLTQQSVFLPLVTMVPMEAPKQEFSKIGMGRRVMRPAKEATALTKDEWARPDFDKIELDAKSFKAEVRITDESLEDNIEGPALQSRIRELMADAIARDIEELAICGDTKSPDPFLATMDGVLVQTRRHVVDAQGQPLSKGLLSKLLKVLPGPEKRNKKNMRFFTGTNAEQDYRSKLAERATAVGDRFLEGESSILAFGVPIVPIPLFPEERGAKHDQTHVLLCDPKNIFVGIWRKIRIESDREISQGVIKIVVSMRFDVCVSEPQATTQAVAIGPADEWGDSAVDPAAGRAA